MTDIELDDLGNRGDRDDIIIIEPVSGMDLEAETRGLARAVGDARSSSRSLGRLSPSVAARQ